MKEFESRVQSDSLVGLQLELWSRPKSILLLGS